MYIAVMMGWTILMRKVKRYWSLEDGIVLPFSFGKVFRGRERENGGWYIAIGSAASINEKGAAAVMTVELDTEKSPQIRVPQGKEHPAFLQLFNGAMIVLWGKSENNDLRKCRNGKLIIYYDFYTVRHM